MYKKNTALTCGKQFCYTYKFLLVMKLSFTILMLAFLKVSASSYAQKVNIHVKDASINEFFYKLTQQTGHTFTADAALVKKLGRININMANKTLKEVLEKCFAGHDVKIVFNEEDKIVIIKSNTDSKIIPQPSGPVTGKVTDEQGEPLAGVSIRIKNTQINTVTDANGNYKIDVPNRESILVFTYLGFTLQEKKVGDATGLNIKMIQATSKLEEIVVVGYGEVKRGDLTGSVGEVKVEDLQKAPVPSFADALAGRIAGVSVSSPDGQPGQMPNIVIRGSNSITQSNTPLYVVDGFPIEGFDANSLNPQDIESLQVLKDASSSAIYGARGANGVIIITTKQGKAGAPVINYNGYYGLMDNRKTIDVMSPYEYIRLQVDLNPTLRDVYEVDGKTLEDYKSVPGYNWQDMLFQTAQTHSHNFSLSGGANNTNYMLSGSIFGQEGTVINSGFDRNQIRFSLNQKINSRLKTGFNANYAGSKQYGTFVSSTEGARPDQGYFLLYSAWAYRPIAIEGSDLENELFDPTISTTTGDSRVNAITQAENQLNQNMSRNLMANGFAEYMLLKDLYLKVTAGYNMINNTSELFNNSLTRTGNPQSAQYQGVNGSIMNSSLNSWVNENTLSYRRKFNKVHGVNFLVGYTQQSRTAKTDGIIGTLLPNESLGLNGITQGTLTPVQPTNSQWVLNSYLTRLNYDYKSKYLLTTSFRADGSSKFLGDNRWSYFPSVALAWRVSRENFMKNLRFFNDVKFRGSYGTTGNNRVSDFPGFSTVSFIPARTYSFGGQYAPGSSPGNLGNPDLRWETTKSTDIGIDITAWKNRITFTADYYHKNTVDLLLNAPLPYIMGYERAFKNIGKVSNSGLEFSLNTVNIKNKELTWTSDFNIAFNRNKVLGLTTNQHSMTTTVGWHFSYNSSPLYIAEIGQPIGMFYGAIWEGNYQYDDFDRQPNGTYQLKTTVPTNGSTSVQPGDIKYKDINGDGIVNEKDYTIIGNPNPKFIGGFNNNFKYKGFDLNVFFQYSYGNDIFNANRLVFENGTQLGINQFASFADRWTPENQSNTMFRARGAGLNYYSSRVIEDGSFIRLKTIQLGYTIPKAILNRAKIKALQVYFSAQNLHTWTNYSGMDPEVSTKNSALTPGFDYSAYPRPKTFTLGINASF